MVPRPQTAMLSRVVFLTVYIISSAWRMRSWAFLASSGIGGDAHGGADVEIDAFAEVELGGAQQIAQAAGDDHGGMFIGLREQDDEFISAVAEGVVDEAEVGLMVSPISASRRLPMRWPRLSLTCLKWSRSRKMMLNW